jgi:dTDP-4-amino-4,6-dideoxygalactose transaminase
VNIVPFVDLSAHHAPIRDEIRAALDRVVGHGGFILGPEVTAFEEEYARFVGARFGIGVGTGLDALRLALEALGIGPGDEVIVPGNTFIATALAVSAVGAVPVLVDVDPETYNIDLDLVRPLITPRTRAIIPVHLYGQAADMQATLALAAEFGLKVVEDACQAHGARYEGKGCGTMGDLGCFSFYPGKNLGALGDGGLVVTNDEALAAAVGRLRSYGEARKYHHVEKGINARLDTLQAAVLRVKLPRLEASNKARQAHAKAYASALAGVPCIVTPKPPARDDAHVYHLYVIRTPRRDELQAFLKDRGIQTGIHYPIPIHRQPAYTEFAAAADRLPVTDRLAGEILSLPMFPELTDDQIARVAAAIGEFHRGRS